MRNRLRWYLRQLLPLRYSWTGECRAPGEQWTRARCTWRMWFGRVFAERWEFGEQVAEGRRG